MNELAEKIQIVINTLEALHMPSTFENVNHLLGCYQLLIGVRDALAETPAAEKEETGDVQS